MLSDLFGDDNEDKYNSHQASNAKKPPEGRSPSGFVGLQNQGATCYLNSLIQAMYMTPELRNGIFQIDPLDLGIHEYEETKQEPVARQDNTKEVNETMLELLKDMGLNEHGVRRALIATENKDLEIALEYYLSNESNQGFNDPPPPPPPSDDKDKSRKKKKKPRQIPLELQRLFTQLQQLESYDISTQDLTTKGFLWQGGDGRVQHDAHELNRLLIDALEKSLKHTKGESLCQSLYQGILLNEIHCLSCHNKSQRQENFYDILLQVIDCEDMARSLRLYTAAELLDGSNKYACSVCLTKQVAHRRVVLRELPPVLTFSCQRFDIDRTTWQRIKVTSRSVIPLLLDMSSYVEGAPGVAEPLLPQPEEALLMDSLRRSMVWLDPVLAKAKEIAENLVESYGEDINPDDLSPELLEDIGVQLQSTGSFLRKLQQEQQSSPLPQSPPMVYELFAIIMHRGTAYSGHYFAYIRDCFGTGVWEAPMESSATSVATSKNSSVDRKSSQGRETGSVSHDAAESFFAKRCFVQQKQGPSEIAPGGTGASIGDVQVAVVVDEDSPVGQLVMILQCDGTDVKPPSPLVVKSLPTKKLIEAVRKNLGQSWKDLYEPTLGPIIDFVAYHDELFLVENNIVKLKRVEVKLLSTAGFDIASRSLIQQPQQQPSPMEEWKEFSPTDQAMGAMSITSSESEEQLRIQADEELARALAEEDSQELEGLPGTPSTASDTGAGDWETQKKKRDRKPKSNKNSIISKNTVDISVTNAKDGNDVKLSSSGVGESKDGLDDVRIKKETSISRVANKLLSKFHGNFFEFNDSQVKPILLSTLKQSFEGRDSAYLAIYRRQGLQNSSSIEDSFTLPIPPTYWSSRVEEENKKLKEDRVHYHRSLTSISIRILFPKHFMVEGCVLRQAVGEEGNQIRRNASQDERYDDESLFKNGLLVTVDYSDTARSVLELVTQQVQDYLVPLGLTVAPVVNRTPASNQAKKKNNKKKGQTALKSPEPTIPATNFSVESFLAQLRFSRLIDLASSPPTKPTDGPKSESSDKSGGSFFYLSEMLDEICILTDVLGRNSTVVLWDGKHLNGQEFRCGEDHRPIPLKIRMLDSRLRTFIEPRNDQDSNAVVSDDICVHNLLDDMPEKDVWLPKSCSIQSLLQEVNNLFKINEDNVVIHQLHKRITSFEGLDLKEKAKKSLIESCSDTTHPSSSSSSSSYGDKLENYSISVLISPSMEVRVQNNKKLMILRDLLSFELLVEDDKARKNGHPYLADLYLNRKNSLWSIRVEVYKNVEPDQQPQDQVEVADGVMTVSPEQQPPSNSHQTNLKSERKGKEKRGKPEDKTTITMADLFGHTDEDLSDRQFEVEVSRSLTVKNLKALIMNYCKNKKGLRLMDDSELTLSVDTGETDFKGGRELTQHSRSLSDSGLYHNAKVILHRVLKQAPIDRSNMDVSLRCTLRALVDMSVTNSSSSTPLESVLYDNATNESTKVGIIHVVTNTSDTVEGFKEKVMTQLLGSSVEKKMWRLRGTDFMDNPTDIIYERAISTRTNTQPLSSASHSLKDPKESTNPDLEIPLKLAEAMAGIKSEDLVLLEKGEAPVKGVSSLQIFIWLPALEQNIQDEILSKYVFLKDAPATNTANNESLIENNVMVNNSMRKSEENLHSSSNFSIPFPTPSEPLTEAQRLSLEEKYGDIITTKKRCLHPLGWLKCREDSSLLDIYKLVHLKIQSHFQENGFTGPDSPDHLLLRDIRPDYLPGKCLWTAEPVAAAMDYSQIGKSRAIMSKKNQKGGKTGVNKAVSRLSVNIWKRGLIVEILKATQREVIPPLGAFRIWVQRLLNPNKDKEWSSMSPSWPPLELVVSGGVAPSVGHLFKQTSDLTGIPKDKLRVFKFNSTTRSSWFEVKPGLRSVTPAVAINKVGVKTKPMISQVTQKKIDNIFQGPYSFQEGDLISVIDIDDSLGEKEIIITRIEDYIEKDRKLKYDSRKSVEKYDKSTKKKKVIVETALSIGGDFDYSDEEHSDEEVNEDEEG